jgi:hypothetical protein
VSLVSESLARLMRLWLLIIEAQERRFGPLAVGAEPGLTLRGYDRDPLRGADLGRGP